MDENICPLCERAGVQLNGEVYCINKYCLAHETDSQEFLKEAQVWLTARTITQRQLENKVVFG